MIMKLFISLIRKIKQQMPSHDNLTNPRWMLYLLVKIIFGMT